VETHDDAEDARGKLAFRAALEPEMIGKVDDTPLPPPPKPVLAPRSSAVDGLVPLASIPETPVNPKPSKSKKPKVAAGAAGASSLDVATARLQKAIATPSSTTAKKSSSKSVDAGTP
jgi:hypothetical protein